MSSGPVSSGKLAGGILVFLEQKGGVLEDVSLEVLGKGREIADRLHTQLTGVLLGEGVGGLADDCAQRGADSIICFDSPKLREFSVEVYLDVLAPTLDDLHPEIVLVGATHEGTTLAASLAVRLKVGLIAHVVDLEIEDKTGKMVGSVPGFGGSIVALCKCKRNPQIATVRPGVFKPAPKTEGRKGTVVNLVTNPGIRGPGCTVLERVVGKSTDIGRAQRVVVAGLGCKDDLESPRRLAEALDATLAVTRPLADKGFAPRDLVVGSSGAALGAKVAVVVGVSGAAHFVSGVRDVGTVIAVNSDPQAQIFQHADYCVVADAEKVLPKLVSELKGGASEA